MGGTTLIADSRKNMFALENFVEQVRGRNLRVPASWLELLESFRFLSMPAILQQKFRLLQFHIYLSPMIAGCFCQNIRQISNLKKKHFYMKEN